MAIMRFVVLFIVIASGAIPRNANAQPLPNARLSLTSQPVMVADVIGVSTLHYTDGSTDLTASISGFAVGAYDVFIDAGVFRFAPMNVARSDGHYVGSINVSVAGQLTAHFSEDYNRKFEVYNAYNQRTLILRVITQERGLLYCPTNQYPAWQPFNNNALNRGTIITGLPEAVEVTYYQSGFLNTQSGAYGLLNAIGWNSTTAPSGPNGGGAHDDINFVGGVRMIALYDEPAATGVNVATMLVGAAVNSLSRESRINSAPTSGAIDGNGVLLIKWRG